ncbi:hypothetical protein [Streptomyces sp. NBC_00996]|nr:hypothetical protein OG390_23465 [Streptomyces sp. NBC_00996]
MTKEPSFEELLSRTRRSAVYLEMRDGYMTSDPDSSPNGRSRSTRRVSNC